MKLVALVLLLSAFSSLTLMEVVQNFNNWNCEEFFIRKPGKGNVHITPTIFTGHQYKKICQRWNNNYRFATVYDTVRRIPVYSAYTFTRQAHPPRPQNEDWKIEPQPLMERRTTLDSIKGYEDRKDMIISPREQNIIRNIRNQAVELDYSGTRYSLGHVFPSLFAADHDQAVSTFTLTNTAPQLEVDNGRWATDVEQPMHNEINANCRLDQNHLAYIVTGVIPGNRWITITRDKEYEQGINVPSHFWSAYCCENDGGAFISGTYIAQQENFNVQRFTMAKFNDYLKKRYGQEFNVFPGLNC